MYNWACALASDKIFAETLKRCNAAIFYCLQFLYTKESSSLSGCKITQNSGEWKERER